MSGHGALKQGALGIFLALGVSLTAPVASRADFIVAAGSDLLETRDGTVFNFPPFGTVGMEGVPLETHDFGGMAGEQPTGTTDTIIERLAAADSGGMAGTAPAIMIELVELQLKSVNPLPLPMGMEHIFVTLQSHRGLNPADPPPGPDSTGTMTITFADMSEGTFDSSLDVHFDVRTGALDGPIIAEGWKTFTSMGTAWDRSPAASAVEIDGVNVFLDGAGTRARDFWPDLIIEDDGGGSRHRARTAILRPRVEIPTLDRLGLVMMAALLALAVLWRLRRTHRLRTR